MLCHPSSPRHKHGHFGDLDGVAGMLCAVTLSITSDHNRSHSRNGWEQVLVCVYSNPDNPRVPGACPPHTLPQRNTSVLHAVLMQHIPCRLGVHIVLMDIQLFMEISTFLLPVHTL